MPQSGTATDRTGYASGALARPPAISARSEDFFPAAPEFRALTPAAQEALARVFLLRNFSAHEPIYLQDDGAEHLYFIRAGYVRLSYLMEDGSAVLCAILPRGESFGELGIFEGSTHCDMATAVDNVTVSTVSLRQFRALCESFPEINAAVGSVVARRYRSYVELTRMLSLKTLSARLAQAVLRLADGLGTHAAIGGRNCQTIGSFVTQTDLGLMARGARSNVNRALKNWERSKWVALQDRSIVILNRPKLESLALQEGLQ